MANELLSAAEAVSLRKRLAEAEARAEQAELDRDAAIASPSTGASADLDSLFAAIASQHFNARLDDDTRAALRAAYDAGWEAKRERGEMLIDQAIATAADRTRERDRAERQRDVAARELVEALGELDWLRSGGPSE